MMNVAFFREINPNYTRLKMDGSSLVINNIDLLGCLSILTKSTEKVRCADLKINKLKLTDLKFRTKYY
jgi:hypothetical protein